MATGKRTAGHSVAQNAKATITAYDQTVSGIFTFNENYEMVSFSTNDRAVIGTDGAAEYVPWSAVCGNYGIGTDGINHPTSFQAVWCSLNGYRASKDAIPGHVRTQFPATKRHNARPVHTSQL